MHYRTVVGVSSVLIAALWSQAALASRPMTWEERVQAQEALERVYEAKRIWPKENPGPKPPFEEQVPRALIEAKVAEALRQSAALERFWQRPLAPGQLQAEMERMVRGSQDRATLGELFAALGNDPERIAEALARPLLAERLLRSWWARDPRFHGETRDRAERFLADWGASPHWSPCGDGELTRVRYHLGTGDAVGEGALREEEPGGDLRLTVGPQELERLRGEGAKARGGAWVEETDEAFVVKRVLSLGAGEALVECLALRKEPFEAWWARVAPELDASPEPEEFTYTLPVLQGGRAPAARCEDLWVPSALSAPIDGQLGHTAVWTGTEMIVWGGGANPFTNRGQRYNPATDTWGLTSTGANCPTARTYHKAVWTGTRMIVWGGFSTTNTGGVYDPVGDTWTATSTGTNCPSARYYHTAVWTGTEMIVWGGYDNAYRLNTGGRYNPGSNTWTATSIGTDVPAERDGHTAVWTGTQMIVWGGNDGIGSINTGGRYTPSSDTWQPTSTGTSCPYQRENHTAVWTGTEMLIWGATSASGGRYDPTTDTWAYLSSSGQPSSRTGHTAVWTGTVMIIWGGGGGGYQNSGGRYNPTTNTWAATSTGANCPTVRTEHSGIWTGSEMIVWGGRSGGNTGGRYDPVTDTWVPTSTGAAYSAGRYMHQAAWTGNEMVVWGGNDGIYYLSTGARYSPATDSWQPTSTGSGCPSARGRFTAVWTGSHFIVWGGHTGSAATNTGSRFNPIANTWSATSTSSPVPTARYNHVAVWTGTEMIAWGGTNTSNYNTGGRYNPTTNTWQSTSVSSPCPLGRQWAVAVWTGTHMVVWGGLGGSSYNTGGRYDPVTNTWLATSTAAPCPSARYQHSAVWTGSEMIVYGGQGGWNSGGRYNPATDVWQAMATGQWHGLYQAAWTGSEMIVWGGAGQTGLVNTGERYSLDNVWHPMSVGEDTPSARQFFSAVWTGSRFLVWGGTPPLTNGGTYLPALPGPVIYGEDAGCESVTLTTEPAVSYQWVRDSSDIGGATGPTYEATLSGNYQVRVVDEYGCTGTSAAKAVTVNPLPSPAISGPDPACDTAELSTGAYSAYQWYRDGSPLGGATGQNYSATTPGSYTVSVTDANGCAGGSGAFVVSASPTPAVTGPGSGCGSVLLSTGEGYANYQWYLDGSPISGGTSSTLSATASGDYTVTVTQASGCPGTSSPKTVTVLPLPAPTIIGGGTVCSTPGMWLFVDTSGTYQWRRDGVDIPGATAQSYTAQLSGSYDVLVTAANGCSALAAPVVVNALFCTQSEVSPPGAIFPAALRRDAGSPTGYSLVWQKIGSAVGYNVYEGTLGATFTYDPAPLGLCGLTTVDLGTGEIRAEIVPSPGDHYYLVTAFNGSSEGPSGYATGGAEIPPAYSTCAP